MKDKGLFFLTRIFFRKKGNHNDLFIRFHKLIVNYRLYYVPRDITEQHVETNEDLLVAIMNNNVKFLLEYDYSKYEDRNEKLTELLDEYLSLLAKKSHSEEHISAKYKKELEYCKYRPNRDFNDVYKEITLKRPDEIEGHYINNGYR
jgi:hypothetical protein